MVLMCIVGELGSGKTATLTYLAWSNWYHKHRVICSNYNLYGIPFTPVKSIEALRKMIPPETPTTEELLAQKEVFFCGDELWRWVDSRCSVMEISEKEKNKIRNKIVTDIIAASRKSFVTVAYTSQTIDQVDRRIRSITDFTVYPIIKGDNDVCIATVFLGPRPSAYSMGKDIRFFCEPVFAMFNTYERVEPLQEAGINGEVVIPIEENPAWIKLLTDRGFNKDEMKNYSVRMEKLIAQT